ncbi:hypothetical protein TrST_g9506 [Triparma strigata]|uniref:Uncharacterized protein n=1 Tax=Triparma strigata TaxID=1606541 RepID=A0A9W7AQ29_9STRA|nr:hypothetical protein TrST_g9506 [Triparma strigata]
MVSDLEINVKDYDYKSDKPLAYTADVYLINYDGHEMVAKVLTLRMLSTVERVKKLRDGVVSMSFRLMPNFSLLFLSLCLSFFISCIHLGTSRKPLSFIMLAIPLSSKI